MNRFIYIEPDGDDDFVIKNKRTDDELGKIYYSHDWKRWVMEPEIYTMFDSECLDAISQFMKNECKQKG